jgi:hypothetical protein
MWKSILCLYTVPENQPTVTVTLQKPDSPGCVNDLRADFQAVPIPPGAVAANGTDMHMAIWQPSTDTMWNFGLCRKIMLRTIGNANGEVK